MSQKPSAETAAAADQPRCPLGFTGTPPAGHPTFAGSSSSKGGPTSRPSKLQLVLTNIPTTLNPRKWTTAQTLLVEVFFLLICITLAIYMPNIKRAWAGSSASGDIRSSSSSSSSSSQIAADAARLKAKVD